MYLGEGVVKLFEYIVVAFTFRLDYRKLTVKSPALQSTRVTLVMP